MKDRSRWEPDLLGEGFVRRTVVLSPDEEGEVVTTVVAHIPSEDPAMPTFLRRLGREPVDGTPAFAFLAIHGWNDYFYQVELARAVSAMGGAFYAVDLRKYGRSLLGHQTFGYIRDLADYDEELHVCADLIYGEHGHGMPLVVYGHSTGGLIAALWADRHPGALGGLVLNAPWIEYHGSTIARQIGTPVVDILARLSPTAVIPTSTNDFYQRSITAWEPDETPWPPTGADPDDPFWSGGWSPDPAFRTPTGAPVRPGWLSAILAGHAKVSAGLAIDCPILVLTSARSITGDTWSEDFRAADCVLDVGQIWKRVPDLGAHTTLVKLRDAVHDVTFSRRSVRESAFREIERFVATYVL
ncbi:MAG: alpha/beta hydrolase [Actinomycetaceae bacterium]|nr:alpha/beta hydrolase [Actinomycetaceae bacterium]